MTPRSITAKTAAKPKALKAGLVYLDTYQQAGTYKHVTVGEKVYCRPKVGPKFQGTVTRIIGEELSGTAIEVEVVDPDRKIRTLLPGYVEGYTKAKQEKVK